MTLENVKDKLWKRLIIVLISPILLPIVLCLIVVFVCLWMIISLFDMLIYGPFMWVKTGKYTLLDV